MGTIAIAIALFKKNAQVQQAADMLTNKKEGLHFHYWIL